MTNTVPVLPPTSQPMSRRDVWLTVSLAVAGHGMPTPRSLTIRDDLMSAYIELGHGHLGEAQEWAGYLDLTRDADVIATDGKKIIVWFSSPWPRGRGGWTWRVGTTIPAAEPETADPALAEQVVAAIGDAP